MVFRGYPLARDAQKSIISSVKITPLLTIDQFALKQDQDIILHTYTCEVYTNQLLDAFLY